MQYFCVTAHFEHKFPCGSIGFVHFRKRIGKKVRKKNLCASGNPRGAKAQEKQALSDTKIQENSISFPTDAKLAKKITEVCNAVAKCTGQDDDRPITVCPSS